MKADYIKAVLELLKSGKDAQSVIKGLEKTLKAKGHERLLGAILRGVLRESAKNYAKATLTLAKVEDQEKLTEDIKEALTKLKVEDYETVMDETITGGFIAEFNHERIDHSYKTKLVKLYRSLTK